MHMRKSITLSPYITDVVARLKTPGVTRRALEEQLGEPVGASESARLGQLVELGARMVMESSREEGYRRLAELYRTDPPTPEIQSGFGAPIEGETPEDLEALFDAIGAAE